MFDFDFERSQDIGVLTFRGELTSKYSDDFKSALMISLSNAERVIVDFKKVSEFDHACVQMFCVALRNSKTMKKRLIFNKEDLKQRVAQDCAACSTSCELFSSDMCMLMHSNS